MPDLPPKAREPLIAVLKSAIRLSDAFAQQEHRYDLRGELTADTRRARESLLEDLHWLMAETSVREIEAAVRGTDA